MIILESIKQRVSNIKNQLLRPKRVAVFFIVLVLMGAIYHTYFAYDIYVIIPAQIGQKLSDDLRSNEILTLTAADADFKFSNDKDGNITFFIRKKDIRKAQQYEALILLIVQRLQEVKQFT